MINHRICDLFAWYETELGQRVMAAELAAIDRLSQGIFGCTSIQLGMYPRHKVHLSGILRHAQIMPGCVKGDEYVHARFVELPIQSSCINAVFAIHVLEFSENPYQLLREIDRALDEDGQLILVGFSPWSLAGLMRVAWPFKQRAVPWSGHYFSRTRVMDWLRLLNFEVTEVESVFFNVPVQRMGVLDRCQWLEKGLRKIFPAAGACYVLHAKKRTIPLSPIRPRWRPQRANIQAARSTNACNSDGKLIEKTPS